MLARLLLYSLQLDLARADSKIVVVATVGIVTLIVTAAAAYSFIFRSHYLSPKTVAKSG